MANVMKIVLGLLKRFRYPYYVYKEIVKKHEERELFWKDAVKRFAEGTAKHGSLEEYKRIMFRHRFLYNEYDAYKLMDLDEKKCDEFISDREMQCIYRKTVQVNVAICFSDKKKALETFAKYVHRKWVDPNEMTFEAFKDCVISMDCIAKPRWGMKGKDVFLIKNKKGDDYLSELYHYCCEHQFIVEEYVRACKEIEEFHPHSLNTVRLVTVSNKDRVDILDAEFRIGVNDNVVDNASSGGVLASIDVVTGMLVGNGIDMQGNEYVTHPDTGKPIMGFVIPYWDEVAKACKEAAVIVPETVFAGWDVCVRQNGVIELIEVNAFPGVFGLQTARKQGLKPRLRTIGKETLGYDPLKLLSVWKKSNVIFDGKYGCY